jgi:2-succinyl-5-enolpyruvyl-6-hydroxy-3-cyclohexene-1-carboxylate synthase
MPFRALSPDGFDFDYTCQVYETKEEAEQAVADFVKRYEKQGYYSSNYGRISIEDLPNHCKIIEA